MYQVSCIMISTLHGLFHLINHNSVKWVLTDEETNT